MVLTNRERPVSGERLTDRRDVAMRGGLRSPSPVTGRLDSIGSARHYGRHAAQEPLRNSVSATSTFARSAAAIDSQFFSALSSVFHEYKCFGLWKSLLATYG